MYFIAKVTKYAGDERLIFAEMILTTINEGNSPLPFFVEEIRWSNHAYIFLGDDGLRKAMQAVRLLCDEDAFVITIDSLKIDGRHNSVRIVGEEINFNVYPMRKLIYEGYSERMMDLIRMLKEDGYSWESAHERAVELFPLTREDFERSYK